MVKLNEVKRSELITKSKVADTYKGKSENRWTAKNKCTIANTVKDYNQIDMNTLWKNDVLKFGVKVQGETDLYTVSIEFNSVLDKIQNEVKNNMNIISRDCIFKALTQAISSSDIYISCTCPDFKYRLSYYASKNDYKSGEKETRASNITNPNDSKGAGCKHILAAINNVSWIRNIASVITNYVNYCKDNMEYNYSKYIFPKVYGMPYNKAVQLTLDNFDENGELIDNLKSDEDIINLSNALGKYRGRIQKGSNRNPVSQKSRK